jgi:hypothetical protein
MDSASVSPGSTPLSTTSFVTIRLASPIGAAMKLRIGWLTLLQAARSSVRRYTKIIIDARSRFAQQRGRTSANGLFATALRYDGPSTIAKAGISMRRPAHWPRKPGYGAGSSWSLGTIGLAGAAAYDRKCARICILKPPKRRADVGIPGGGRRASVVSIVARFAACRPRRCVSPTQGYPNSGRTTNRTSERPIDQRR